MLSMVSLRTGPSSDRTYLEPGIMSSCWRPFLQVVFAGGMETASLQIRVMLVSSWAVTRGSPSGYGGSGREGQTLNGYQTPLFFKNMICPKVLRHEQRRIFTCRPEIICTKIQNYDNWLIVIYCYIWILVSLVCFFCIVDNKCQFEDLSLGIKCSVNKIWQFAIKTSHLCGKWLGQRAIQRWHLRPMLKLFDLFALNSKNQAISNYHDVKLWKAVNPYICENGPSQCLTILLKKIKD